MNTDTDDDGEHSEFDTRYYESKETTIVGRVAERLKAKGIPASEGEALRYRGLGRKGLQKLIRMGVVVGRLDDPARQREILKKRKEAERRRIKERSVKVTQMISDTEDRLRSLKKELKILSKTK